MTLKQAGTVVTVRSVLNLVGILVGGRLLSKFKAFPTVIACAIINASMYFLAAMPIPLVMSIALSTNGLMAGLYYSFESELILNSCTKTQQAHVYSIIRTLINVGGAVGPLVASAFSKSYGSIFFIILGLVSLIYPLTLLTMYKVQNEVRNIEECEEKSIEDIEESDKRFDKKFKAFAILLITLTIGTVSISAFSSVVPMLISEKGGTPFSYTVGVWINTIGIVACQIPIQSLLDKIGAWKSTCIGLLIIFFSFLPMSAVTNPFWFYLGTIIFTIGELFFSLNASLLLLSYAEGKHAGEYLSLSKLRTYVASPIAAAAGTFAIVRFGSLGYYLMFSAFSLTSIAMMLFIFFHNKAKR